MYPRLVPLQPPKNQFGIILDGLVVSSPYFQEPILGGTASINGNFTNQQAKDLANVLKYGALPVNLQIAEITSVSPTLGADQLKAGPHCRSPRVAVGRHLPVAVLPRAGNCGGRQLDGSCTADLHRLCHLGRTVGLALTLAGVAGAIVSIGITADSFVVYLSEYETTFASASRCEWHARPAGARPGIPSWRPTSCRSLPQRFSHFISVGNVRGFAFTLGLTTVIDVVVAFPFTRPIVALLARSKWFTGRAAHWVSPERLGVEPSRELKKHRQNGLGASTRKSRLPLALDRELLAKGRANNVQANLSRIPPIPRRR